MRDIIGKSRKKLSECLHFSYSLSIAYFFTFGNFFAVPIVELVGVRLSMFSASITTTIFVLGFIFLNQYYLYISSAIVGFGSAGTIVKCLHISVIYFAVLWTANGYYLTLNSNEKTSHRNSAMMVGLIQSWLA